MQGYLFRARYQHWKFLTHLFEKDKTLHHFCVLVKYLMARLSVEVLSGNRVSGLSKNYNLPVSQLRFVLQKMAKGILQQKNCR